MFFSPCGGVAVPSWPGSSEGRGCRTPDDDVGRSRIIDYRRAVLMTWAFRLCTVALVSLARIVVASRPGGYGPTAPSVKIHLRRTRVVDSRRGLAALLRKVTGFLTRCGEASRTSANVADLTTEKSCCRVVSLYGPYMDVGCGPRRERLRRGPPATKVRTRRKITILFVNNTNAGVVTNSAGILIVFQSVDPETDKLITNEKSVRVTKI